MYEKSKILLNNPFFRYLAPLAVFMLLGVGQGVAHDPTLFWLGYAAKISATAAVFMLVFRYNWQEIEGKWDLKAVVSGLLVLAAWLAYYHAFKPPFTPAYDPALLPSSTVMIMAVFIRVLGAVTVTPLLEELVWRSFIMRFLIKEDFLSVRLGTYTFWSFWGTAATFMIVHPLWLWPVAAFAGIVYGAYLLRTKNLWGCIIAHGVTNLGLSLYALATGEWGLWG